MIPRVIGISGPSGSGKSTAARAVSAHVHPSVVVEQDWYFRDAEECPADANFCELRWLHVDQFIGAVVALASGRPADVPVMDFATFRRAGTRTLHPAPLVIVEGMTIFRIAEVAECFTSKYYLDADIETISERKRARDGTERQKTPNVIEEQLRWIVEEYDRDASLRARDDVTVLRGDAAIPWLIEEISASMPSNATPGRSPALPVRPRHKVTIHNERAGTSAPQADDL